MRDLDRIKEIPTLFYRRMDFFFYRKTEIDLFGNYKCLIKE